MDLRRVTDWTLLDEFYEAWAAEDRTGCHYEIAHGLSTRES